MSAALLRKYHKEKILINPFSLSGNLYPLVDNGYGEMIEDTAGVLIPKSFTNPVRIAFTKKWIRVRNESGTPVSIEKRVYFMISDYETIVDLRLEFVYNGVTLKVLQRKELRKFGSIIGYEYELNDLTEENFNA